MLPYHRKCPRCGRKMDEGAGCCDTCFTRHLRREMAGVDLFMLLPGEKANAWAVGFVRGRHDHELRRAPVNVRPDVALQEHTWISVDDWAQVAPWCLGDDARRDTVTDTFTGTLRWEREI